MDELTEQQRRRLSVLRHYNAYVRALRHSNSESERESVHEARRALAHAIEHACPYDYSLLEDFRRAFAARPQT